MLPLVRGDTATKIKTMNFCKDCKHFVAGPTGIGEYNRCAKSAVIDPVMGVATLGYCSVQRNPGMFCGPEAKLFEPKEAVR